MSEMPIAISLAEPKAKQEPDPRWRVALTIGKIGLLLMIWILITCIVIPYPNDKFEISVVTVRPNETLIRRLKLPNDAMMIPVRGPIKTQVQKFLKDAENVSMAGLRLEWWKAGENNTIPCATVWDIYQQEDHEALAEAPKLFEIATPECNGNKTMMLMEEKKCEYSVFLLKEADSTPLVTNLWIVYAALMLMEVYIVIVFKPKDDLFIALLVATTGLAILTALGNQPTDQMIVLWTNYESELPMKAFSLL